jgi:hypothetical protein
MAASRLVDDFKATASRKNKQAEHPFKNNSRRFPPAARINPAV